MEDFVFEVSGSSEDFFVSDYFYGYFDVSFVVVALEDLAEGSAAEDVFYFVSVG